MYYDEDGRIMDSAEHAGYVLCTALVSPEFELPTMETC